MILTLAFRIMSHNVTRGMIAELKLSKTAAALKQSTNVASQRTLKVRLDLSHFGMPERTFSCSHANLL